MNIGYQKPGLLNKFYWIFFTSLLGILFVVLSTHSVKANTANVVINELMYHASSDVDDDDYLELFNTNTDPVDMSGWCFKGITLCFDGGTVIQPHEYVIVSRNTARTQSVYGVTPIANYTANLSNSGEKITLNDADGNVVDEVTYSDSGAWPTTPDGGGPSLELKDPLSDHNDPASWAASLNNGGTPAAKNSVSMVDLPIISDVSKYTIVPSSQTVNITATLENATSAQLVYKTMFNPEVTVNMFDDGIHHDDVIGDGVFGASIPAQSGGTLVRYKIVASNADGYVSAPGNDDTINYFGYIVDDGQTADIPIVRWYMDPADFDDMITNHYLDQQQFPAVIAVGGELVDNALVRVKGQGSVHMPKKNFKFDLPKGYFVQPPDFEYPIKEFSIRTSFMAVSDMQEALMWRTFTEFGFKDQQKRYVRLQKNDNVSNSTFYGHYLLLENYDGNWREKHGYETGAMYKEFYDKKNPKDGDYSAIEELKTNLSTLQGDDLKNYIYNNLNIPAIVNYHAVNAITNNYDWNSQKNIYEYHDTSGSGRWQYLPWDLDNGFLPSTLKDFTNIDNLTHPVMGEVSARKGLQDYLDFAFIEKAMYQFPEIRQMFFRRSMNMFDTIWKSDKYKEWFDELYAPSEATMIEDVAKWSSDKKAAYHGYFPDGLPWAVREDFPADMYDENFFSALSSMSPAEKRALIFDLADLYKDEVKHARLQGQLLGTQTALQEARLKINEIMYSSSDGEDYNFVEIFNSGNDPVDVSNWRLSGIDFTFASGTVITAKGYGVIVKNDKLFRSKYPGKFVLGEYNGKLKLTGESLALKDAGGKVISEVTYGVDGEWPVSPSASGQSLTLIRSSANTKSAACWAPSGIIGGTPGAINNFDQSWFEEYSANCDNQPTNSITIRNKLNNADIKLTSPDSTILTCYASIAATSLSKKDNNYKYPLGLVDFCFDTDTKDNQVSLTFVTDLMPNQVKPRKYNTDTNTYSDLPASANATITETTINNQHALVLSYTIEDNGDLDLDKTLGKIKDPVGLAVTNELYNQLANTGTNAMLYSVFAGVVATGDAILAFAAKTNKRLKFMAR